MQKYEFQYRKHELDELNVRCIYESTYDEAIANFIDWVYKNGYIGYFEDKTIIGNPANRSHINYTDDLSHASIDVYVLQYVIVDYHGNFNSPSERKIVQLFMSDSIDDFIASIKELESRENVKSIVTYKGNLVEFNHNQLATPF